MTGPEFGGVTVEYRCPDDHQTVRAAASVVTLLEGGRGWHLQDVVGCSECSEVACLYTIWWESDQTTREVESLVSAEKLS
jgi:hypothetical protein